MALLRVTEDFVHHYRNICDRTGNSPSNIQRALGRNIDLPHSIRRLCEIDDQLNRQRRFGSRRFVIQAHPEFHKAYKDYCDRWRVQIQRVFRDHPDLVQEDIAPITIDLNIDLEQLSSIVVSSEALGHEASGRFDPEKDDVTEAFNWLRNQVREFAESCGDDWGDWTSSAIDGLDWFVESVGLNFAEVQRRWIEFPVIVVPHHVSDEYSPDQPRGLYGGLNEIREAYIVGADLAAIAMCRAVTDLLIRDHYNHCPTGDLTPLIRSTERQSRFTFLKKFNLAARVKEANDILHEIGREDIRHRSRYGSLVIGWVRDLQEVISYAPVNSK